MDRRPPRQRRAPSKFLPDEDLLETTIIKPVAAAAPAKPAPQPKETAISKIERMHPNYSLFEQIMAARAQLLAAQQTATATVRSWKIALDTRTIFRGPGNPTPLKRNDFTYWNLRDGNRIRSLVALRMRLLGEGAQQPNRAAATPPLPQGGQGRKSSKRPHTEGGGSGAAPATSTAAGEEEAGATVAAATAPPPQRSKSAKRKKPLPPPPPPLPPAPSSSSSPTASTSVAASSSPAPSAGPSATPPLSERYRRKLCGRPICLIGDSIAQELGAHMTTAEGFVGGEEVHVIARAGATPSDIALHLQRWLAADPKEHLSLLRQSALLVVCAGKNLCRSTPSLIVTEVNKHIVQPLQELVPHVGSASHPACLVEPLTRDFFTRNQHVRSRAAAQAPLTAPPPAAGAGSLPIRRSGRMMEATVGGTFVSQTHHEMADLSRRSGFKFLTLSSPLLLGSEDFRDNLHLYGEGYRKMTGALLLHVFGDTAAEEDEQQQQQDKGHAHAHARAPAAPTRVAAQLPNVQHEGHGEADAHGGGSTASSAINESEVEVEEEVAAYAPIFADDYESE